MVWTPAPTLVTVRSLVWPAGGHSFDQVVGQGGSCRGHKNGSAVDRAMTAIFDCLAIIRLSQVDETSRAFDRILLGRGLAVGFIPTTASRRRLGCLHFCGRITTLEHCVYWYLPTPAGTTCSQLRAVYIPSIQARLPRV